MSEFQTGGVKGKAVTDNLFILRGIINHANYLKKELWVTFYDIEKCFDSLWLEDCINSLWKLGIHDDTLYLCYLMNQKARITVKTLFGDTLPFIATNLVKQGTCLGPILNNCSLSEVCDEGHGYNFGTVEVKALEFVDDIADPNGGVASAQKGNDVIAGMQDRKRLKFSGEKCKILKINSRDTTNTLTISDTTVDVEKQFKYLGDVFNSQGNNIDLSKTRAAKSTGTSIEIISLCKEVKFGKKQIANMFLLYSSLFIPRLIYNCEAWSNVTDKEISFFQDAQLNFLCRVMEVPRSTPTAGVYLELGILPIRYEIEIRQLLYLRKILMKDVNDPVLKIYCEMLKYPYERNWANCILDSRHKYNLPLCDDNISDMTKSMWKVLVKNRIKKHAFEQLLSKCQENKKTSHLRYHRLERASYVTNVDPEIARIIFKARPRVFDVKENFKKKYSYCLLCPFCKAEDVTFNHLFKCSSGLFFNSKLKNSNLMKVSHYNDLRYLKHLGRYLIKYQKYREIFM